MKNKPTVLGVLTVGAMLYVLGSIVVAMPKYKRELPKSNQGSCGQNLKQLWQSVSIYQSDYGETGELLGYPPIQIANQMQTDLKTPLCTESAFHDFISPTLPYLYMPRVEVKVYGKPLVGSFADIRGREGDSAVLWADINHNSNVPPLMSTYPFKVTEINRGGSLYTISRKGAWQMFSGSFWQRK